MEIVRNDTEKTVELKLCGRLDTNTAAALEAEIAAVPEDCEALVLDMAELSYISSAGLRVLLLTQKSMRERGSLIVRNVCEDVMDIFEITGFSEILTIE